jgi:hypothetical protein
MYPAVPPDRASAALRATARSPHTPLAKSDHGRNDLLRAALSAAELALSRCGFACRRQVNSSGLQISVNNSMVNHHLRTSATRLSLIAHDERRRRGLMAWKVFLVVVSVQLAVPAHAQDSCPEGAALDGDGLCVECAPGLRDPDGAGGSGPCTLCPAGLFSERSGSSACSACAAGTFSSGGSAHCTPCAPGTYDHDHSATTPCQPCPRDSFQDESGGTACDMCPQRPRADGAPGPTYTATLGSNSSELCQYVPEEYVGCFADMPLSPTNNMETMANLYQYVDDVLDLEGESTTSQHLCREVCQERMSAMYMSLTGMSECRW